MTRYEYTNTMPYIFDSERKGSKYSMTNGETWKNHGEWCESIAKFHRGLDYIVNPTTAWNEGSDIESLNASVKSSNATLATIFGNTPQQIMNKYFAEVPSTLWIFVVDIDEDTIVEYHMNKEEFKEFLNEWYEFATASGSHLKKIRIKKVSGKMIRWLEERVA